MSRRVLDSCWPEIVLGAAVVLVCLGLRAEAQEASVVINEVIADNGETAPSDVGGGTPDMVEIFNTGSAPVSLGPTSTDAGTAFALSDRVEFCEANAWTFPDLGITVPPGGSIIVFCDENENQGDCEPHASFRIASDGSEPISLWGPEDASGQRPLLDQVWLPPLKKDHSFGRFPDGAGPAPVPIEETLSVFRINAPQNTSFGSCTDLPGTSCSPSEDGPQVPRRSCAGAANGSGDNIKPRVEQEEYSTNAPADGEALHFTVRVEDDGDPTPGNIARVQIRYWVDGQEQPPVDMEYDSSMGILTGAKDEVDDTTDCGLVKDFGKPLQRWSIWSGSIPGLPAGSQVAYEFFVEDQQGLSDADPSETCPPGVGPCDAVGLPGPGCVKELGCIEGFLTGCPFEECQNLRQYLVGYEPPEGLSGVVINEMVTSQTNILKDPSQVCRGLVGDDLARCGFEDFIELHNTTDQAVDLSGLWLSPRPFRPQGWQFPEGSVLQPQEYLIVWTDNDGGKCPRPGEEKMGDGQECPDPTIPDRGSYHTDFNLDASGDQIMLYQETENGFGLVHGHRIPESLTNFSWSVTPDGDRDGTLRAVFGGTPGRPNDGAVGPLFRRGDANGDCTLDLVDPQYYLNFQFLGGPALPCPDAADSDDDGRLNVTDAIFTLGFLFLDGPRPAPPGPFTAGLDPSEDTLGECTPPDC